MSEPEGTLSRQEAQFDRWHRRIGLLAAPMVFTALWCLPVPDLPAPAHRLLAVFGLVVTLWITEAIPLAVTILLASTLRVVCSISSEKEIFKSVSEK